MPLLLFLRSRCSLLESTELVDGTALIPLEVPRIDILVACRERPSRENDEASEQTVHQNSATRQEFHGTIFNLSGHRGISFKVGEPGATLQHPYGGIMPVQLGKMPFGGIRYAPTLMMRTFIDRRSDTLPPVPATLSWAGAVSNWGMLGNHDYMDCTTAAVCHMMMCWTANALGAPIAFTDKDALDAYQAVNPQFRYVIGNPKATAGDKGAYCQDVLDLWIEHGIAGRKITDYALLDFSNPNQVIQSVALFGGCYIGLQLPDNALPTTTATGQLNIPSWDFSSNQIAANPKNPKNGHAVAAIGYDATGINVVTWATTQHMNWTFFNAYMDEAWTVLSTSDWTSPDGETPSNLDAQQLVDDFADLRSEATA